MNIFVFILAAVLSMPKQFITVYIGTLLESSSDGMSLAHLSISRSSPSRFYFYSKQDSQLRRWMHHFNSDDCGHVVHSKGSEQSQARSYLCTPEGSVSHIVFFVEHF